MLDYIINQRTQATKNVLWLFFMLDKAHRLEYGILIQPLRHLEYTKTTHAILLPQRIIHYMNELYQKEAQKVCKARNCSHVQVDFRPTRNGKSEEHITVRNSYKNGNDPCS